MTAMKEGPDDQFENIGAVPLESNSNFTNTSGKFTAKNEKTMEGESSTLSLSNGVTLLNAAGLCVNPYLEKED